MSSFVDFNLTIVNKLTDFLGRFVVNGAPDGDACAYYFLDSALEFLGETLWSELLGDVDNIIDLEVAVVLHVFDLLSVSGALLQCLDD
jgi:hypothetical protein